jgi:outer membrane autotransporter protein
VTLRLDRNDTSFRSVASTPNHRAVASALETLGAENELHSQLVFADAALADAAFQQLAGELHPSAAGAVVEIGNAIDRNIRDRIGAAMGEDASAVGTETARLGDGHLWWQAYGSWADMDGGEVSGLDRDATGTLVGFDTEIASGWTTGFFAGYGNGSIDMDEVAASAEADSYHLGIYGGTRRGALGLRLGASHSLNRLDTQRQIAFGDRAETLTADYDAATTRLYGEANWRIDGVQGGFEPYVALAHVSMSSDGFTETGGAAALSSDGIDVDTTYSTLGLRAERAMTLGSGHAVLRGELGWQHAFGDIDPLARMAFAGAEGFDVTGTPIAEDSAVLRAAIDMQLAPNATVAVGYAGQYGDGLTDHGVTADLSVRF